MLITTKLMRSLRRFVNHVVIPTWFVKITCDYSCLVCHTDIHFYTLCVCVECSCKTILCLNYMLIFYMVYLSDLLKRNTESYSI